MSSYVKLGFLLFISTLIFNRNALAGIEMSGEVSPETRIFMDNNKYPEQGGEHIYSSISAEAKLVATSSQNDFSFTANPYLRYDKIDSNRSILDLHELNIGTRGRNWYAKVGYDVEFWGVMEFVNPVNIINQSDITEDFLGKRKLGQPMAKITFINSLGTFDFYALEYFQPMTFPGLQGRLRSDYAIQNEPEYLSEHKRSQVEGAFHYTKTVDNVYIGISHFYGYSREPAFLVKLNDQLSPYLVPQYYLQHQTGAELQVTLGNLILKSEDVIRYNELGTSYAVAAGGEYDLGTFLGKGYNLNLLSEYYLDQREESLITPFNKDIFLGARIGLNDKRSTEIKVWTNYDFHRNTTDVIMLDASIRITDRLKAQVSYRGIISKGPLFASVSNDSYVLFRLEMFM